MGQREDSVSHSMASMWQGEPRAGRWDERSMNLAPNVHTEVPCLPIRGGHPWGLVLPSRQGKKGLGHRTDSTYKLRTNSFQEYKWLLILRPGSSQSKDDARHTQPAQYPSVTAVRRWRGLCPEILPAALEKLHRSILFTNRAWECPFYHIFVITACYQFLIFSAILIKEKVLLRF